jgi:hypothetical protein
MTSAVTTADSMWIGQDAAGSGDVGSPYTFRLSFDLTGFDPASVRITGAWGVDNNGDITLNGQVPTGMGTFSLSGADMDNFNVEHDFTITGGFVAGMNTLDIQVTNTGGPVQGRGDQCATNTTGGCDVEGRVAGCGAALVMEVGPPGPLMQGVVRNHRRLLR